MLELFLFLIVVIQLLYYVFLFSRFSFSKTKTNPHRTIPISIIICAKNEAKNLEDFLPSIILQKHKNFEIILVNDHSTDGTLKVMQFFTDIHANIKIVNLTDKKSTGNKKNALTQGIKAAKHEYLLFTDADCVTYSDQWISEMTSHFTNKKEVVLGYGAYQKIKKSWLNKLIRFETLLTAIQYFSYTKANLTYMGVGRNLAYTKTLFTKTNGFESHKHIKSGDDDLFINQVANNNVSCCYSESSFTYSKPHTNFKKWMYQKRRHISTANSYKLTHQILLGLFYVSQFLFWSLTIYLLLFSENKQLVFSLFIFRTAFLYLIYGFSAKKLKETDLIPYLPFLELFLIIVQMRIFMQNLISEPKTWS
jgi:cellulose synthase/poly-beta-1,6-N-acetylglucosamine synthase-like glycosyltransferase